jgi:hypothetical protein
VQRWFACLLVAILLAPWGQALPQHVHAGADHDHPEHQHGPAAHAHQQEHYERQAIHEDAPDGAPHVEACAAADHALSSISAITVSAPAFGFAATLVASRRTPILRVPTRLTPRLTDVRVHDPPRRARTSPRAPPLPHLA